MKEKKLLDLKKEIINEILRKKEEELHSLVTAQQEELKAATEGRDEPTNLMENRADEMINEVRLKSDTVDRLTFQVQYLKSMDPEATFEKVGVGAVVETDRRNFFIAVPETEFMVKDTIYTGISKESPIFQAMRGLGEGDTLEWNGKKFKIKRIY